MDQLPVRKLNDGDGRDVDLAAGGGEPQPAAVVSAGYAQAHGHFVAFSYRVFHGDVQIRKGASHVATKGLNSVGPWTSVIGGSQSKAYAFRRK